MDSAYYCPSMTTVAASRPSFLQITFKQAPKNFLIRLPKGDDQVGRALTLLILWEYCDDLTEFNITMQEPHISTSGSSLVNQRTLPRALKSNRRALRLQERTGRRPEPMMRRMRRRLAKSSWRSTYHAAAQGRKDQIPVWRGWPIVFYGWMDNWVLEMDGFIDPVVSAKESLQPVSERKTPLSVLRVDRAKTPRGKMVRVLIFPLFLCWPFYSLPVSKLKKTKLSLTLQEGIVIEDHSLMKTNKGVPYFSQPRQMNVMKTAMRMRMIRAMSLFSTKKTALKAQTRWGQLTS